MPVCRVQQETLAEHRAWQGSRDFCTRRRYVHPQAHTVREAMERARNGHDNATPGTDTAQSG